ncbi:MAG: class I SAM-dependent RNA methyltransferase [Bacillota bacterium]|nr:class I SAM-dependent RNA methyltransferase [Bacillota bacterium]
MGKRKGNASPMTGALSRTVELEITDLTDQGAGIGRDESGRVIFVEGAVPGDRILCRIFRSKKNYALARIERILRSSPDRVEPRCPHFGVCGGCSLQHLRYDAQKQWKKKLVFDALIRIGGFADFELDHAYLGFFASEPFRYRNKGRFFATGAPHFPGDPGPRFGMMARGSRRIVPITDCLLMPESFAERLAEAPQDSDRPEMGSPLILKSYGDTHQIADIQVTVRGDAFFQVNDRVADAMYRQALAMVDLRPGDRVVELYSGVGGLTLLFAQVTGNALGVEINRDAVKSAWENARRNGLEGAVSFVCADVLDAVSCAAWSELNPSPRLIVLDPPRAGCDPKVLDLLDAPEILYISCDPATLARDLRLLRARGYLLRALSIHDMFAQTTRVECIALIQRGES